MTFGIDREGYGVEPRETPRMRQSEQHAWALGPFMLISLQTARRSPKTMKVCALRVKRSRKKASYASTPVASAQSSSIIGQRKESMSLGCYVLGLLRARNDCEKEYVSTFCAHGVGKIERFHDHRSDFFRSTPMHTNAISRHSQSLVSRITEQSVFEYHARSCLSVGLHAPLT